MRRFQMYRVLVGALFTLALPAGHTARADEQGVYLLVTPKIGRAVRTRTVVNVTLLGMEMVMNGTSKDIVKEVKPNGDVVIETIDEGGTVTANGMKTAQPATPPHTSTHNKFGKTIDNQKDPASGFTTPEVDKLMDSITDILLTDKAVKTNDTWETELENPAVKAKKVLVKDTYLGVEKIDGKDYWKIKQTAEAVTNADGNTVTYEITEWIAPTDGAPLKFEATVKNVPTQFGVMSMKIHSTTIR